jgi:hypothetical protein
MTEGEGSQSPSNPVSTISLCWKGDLQVDDPLSQCTEVDGRLAHLKKSGHFIGEKGAETLGRVADMLGAG